jgi:hypothetical protein
MSIGQKRLDMPLMVAEQAINAVQELERTKMSNRTGRLLHAAHALVPQREAEPDLVPLQRFIGEEGVMLRIAEMKGQGKCRTGDPRAMMDWGDLPCKYGKGQALALACNLQQEQQIAGESIAAQSRPPELPQKQQMPQSGGPWNAPSSALYLR